MNYQKLFDYISNEHGVTLLQQDMQDIVNIVNEMQSICDECDGTGLWKENETDKEQKCPKCRSHSKQTAVEWLYHELNLFYWTHRHDGISRHESSEIRSNLLKKALEMETKQIVYAHLSGLLRTLDMEATKQANEYYNETYGKEDK